MDALSAWITIRARVLGLSNRLAGADFAEERGWLSAEEREELDTGRKAWPGELRSLRDATRRARQADPEGFKAWWRSQAAGRSEDYARRVRAVIAGRSEDPVFTFVEGGPVDLPANLVALLSGPLPEQPLLVRAKELSRLLGAKVAVGAWVEAGCPHSVRGRTTLFPLVEVLRWTWDHSPPVPLSQARALVGAACRLHETSAFLGTWASVRMARSWGVAVPDAQGPSTSSVAALMGTVKGLEAALWATGWYRDDQDLDVEVRWLLAEGLNETLGNPGPLRTLSGKERYRVLYEEHAGGGLFELEIRHTWRVQDWTTKQIVLTLRGDTDADYEGGHWVDHRSSGVEGVTLTETGVLVHRGGATESIPLPGARPL